MKNISIELSEFNYVDDLWPELINKFGFEKSKKISEAAILKVREELISLQNSQLELRKQIEFYKNCKTFLEDDIL